VARVHEALVREELDSAPGPEWAEMVKGLRAELAEGAEGFEAPASVPSGTATVDAARPQTAQTHDASTPSKSLVATPDPTGSDATPANASPPARRWASHMLATAAVLLVVALGALALYSSRASTTQLALNGRTDQAATKPVSIAVLPFVNIGADPADEPFSDGLTDELIAALGKLPGIHVTGRTSAFALKGRGLNVRTIADTLGVDAVLEGSVRRAGNRLRITTQLVSAGDNGVLWTATYDRKLEDVFAVQEEIANAIVAALPLTPEAHAARVGTIQSRDLATYDLYLKGRYFWSRRSPPDLRRAVDYFQQAIARDSTYAQAYAGLADARVLLVILGDSPPAEQVPLARAAATAAIRLDSTLSEAHAALGNILEAFDWDRAGADREISRSIALDPGYATAHLYRGIHLLNRGRLDEALTELTLARTLDPLSAPVRMQLGRAYAFGHRTDEAVASLRTAVELNPSFTAAHLNLGDAYLQQNRTADALSAFSRAAALNGGRDSAQLAYGLAVTGRTAEARRLLNALVSPSRGHYLPPVPVAKAYIGLGDANSAFRWLERGFDDRAAQMSTIKATTAFDALHSDPRWARLLQRLKLDP
jgi:serine/threonine-protein kinase